MKRIFITLGLFAIVSSCTQNERIKHWGAEGTIILPKGRKLVTVTWKESELWYLTKPMTETDVAESYRFQEESSWGIMEGTYNIIESK